MQHSLPHLPAFIAPAQFTDAALALAQVQKIYNAQIEHLRSSMQQFVKDDAADAKSHLRKVRACYPFVRIHTDRVSRSELPDLARLSFGFVAGPGRYETTLTRPDLYASYYLEQFRLLLQNHKVVLEIGTSTQPIPIHFSFAEHDHVEGSMSAERRALMRDVFDLPDLAAMDDGIANGTFEPKACGLLAAPPAPLHRHRA
jgi:AMP nucleosidase